MTDPQAPDVLTLIRRHFTETPERTAVVVGGHSMTYRGLESASRALAARLAAAGAARGRIVMIHRRQDLRTVVAMTALLRLGAAWWVTEPGPSARSLRASLRVSGCRVVVYDPGPQGPSPATVPEFARGSGAPVALVADRLGDTVLPDPPAGEPPGLDAPQPGGSPAYVVATSGSTGEPKPVIVSRSALAHLIAARSEAPGQTTFSPCRLSWDGPLLLLFQALCTGGTAVLPDDRSLPDAEAAAALIRRHRVTLAAGPPSFHRLLLPHLTGADTHLRTCIFAGEALPAALVREYRSALPRTRLVNEYGATETTLTVLAHPVLADRDDPVPLGRPTGSARVYVLDERLTPVQPGQVGELYVAGPQVADGYAGRADATALRFVADPFVAGDRMYRTGDLAGVDDAGALSFRGRADAQSKVRGTRVERHAVEAALEAHPRIRQAVVLEAPDGYGGTQLAAFYTVRDPGSGTPAVRDLLDHCARRLVAQAVPERLVRIPAVPLTPSGKTDHTALRALLPDPAGPPAEEDGNDAREAVARLWAEVLGHAEFGPYDDFFAVGGNSRRVVELHLRLERAWPGAIRVGRLFDLVTVADQAGALAAARPGTAADAGPSHAAAAPVTAYEV